MNDSSQPPSASSSPDSHAPQSTDEHPICRLRLSIALQAVLQQTLPSPPSDDPAHTTQPVPLTLKLIIDTTGKRAFGVLMAFLCIPFLTPIPVPGLSIPFGLGLVLLGAQVAFRKHRPWLPAKLLNRPLPQKLGARLIGFVARIFRPLEKIIRPRLLFMQNRGAMILVGTALAIDGLLLSLPLPPIIPFSNAIPAWMAMIKILGITEEDGVSLLTGTLLTLATTIGAIYLIVVSWHKVVAWWG